MQEVVEFSFIGIIPNVVPRADFITILANKESKFLKRMRQSSLAGLRLTRKVVSDRSLSKVQALQLFC